MFNLYVPSKTYGEKVEAIERIIERAEVLSAEIKGRGMGKVLSCKTEKERLEAIEMIESIQSRALDISTAILSYRVDRAFYWLRSLKDVSTSFALMLKNCDTVLIYLKNMKFAASSKESASSTSNRPRTPEAPLEEPKSKKRKVE